jgi:alpha-mannosidase
LPEAEVTPEGAVAVTLLRSVGWLSHTELRQRPILAGPALVTPDAQCATGITAEISLRIVDDQDPRGVGGVAACAVADELGLKAVPAGPIPLVPEDTPLLNLEPAWLLLSALKPAEDGRGLIIRVLNPADDVARAVVTVGFDPAGADSVRLDETSDGANVELTGRELTFPVGPHALRSLRLWV